MNSHFVNANDEELESDVEIVERTHPIPGHEHHPHSHLPQPSSVSSDTHSSESGYSTTDDETYGDKSASPTREASIEEQGKIPHVYPIPKWFPRRIKKMFEINRKGGSLKFKELDEMTKYRTALERAKRVCWRTYIDAGRKRYQFQRFLRKHRFHRSTIPLFYKFQRKQYEKWREKAFERWKILEKLHLGVRVLDETIHLNFRMERLLYEARLGGRFRG